MGEIKTVCHSGQLKIGKKSAFLSSLSVIVILSIFIFIPIINIWFETNKVKELRNKNIEKIQQCELYLKNSPDNKD